MNVRIVSSCAVTCAMSLLFAATASAQWSSPTTVGTVEGLDQLAPLQPSVSAAGTAWSWDSLILSPM